MPGPDPRKNRMMGPKARQPGPTPSQKKQLEKIVDDTATENIFSKFRTKIKKAEKQYKDIPSGMKKDPRTAAEIKTKLLKDDKPFREFKDTRREVFATQRMAKGGRAGLKGGGICKRGMNRQAIGKNS